MVEGAIYRYAGGGDYILHKLPTGNWVLINKLTGHLWCSTKLHNTDPIDAFGGDKWFDKFTLITPQ